MLNINKIIIHLIHLTCEMSTLFCYLVYVLAIVLAVNINVLSIRQTRNHLFVIKS
jgi:hypothetical protein